MPEAQFFKLCKLLCRGCRIGNPRTAVDFLYDCLYFLPQGQIIFVQYMETALFLQCGEHLSGKRDTAFAAFFPYFGKSELTASLLTEFLHIGQLRLRIRQECI